MTEKSVCKDCTDKCHLCFKKGQFTMRLVTDEHAGFNICDPCWYEIMKPVCKSILDGITDNN